MWGEVNKVSCSLLVGALWLVVRIRRRPGTKGSQLRPLGLVHWQASWPLSTRSGQDVSLSEKESPPESPFVAGRGTPFQGPKLGSCLTLGNELSEETRANKGNLVRVSDPRSEDDISDSVYSSQVRGAF